jgi:hypothetical protein
MTDTFRALCAELMDAIDSGIPVERIKQSPLAVRIDAALAQPEPEGVTARELQWPPSVAQGCHEAAAEAEPGSPMQQLLVAAGDLLENYARPAIEPVPVAERLPGPEDCDAEGRCWLHQPHPATPETPEWRLMPARYASTIYNTTHWLPAHALPVPSSPTLEAP